MASSLSSSLHINALATAKKEFRAGNCDVSLWNVTNVNVNGNSSTRRIRGRQEIVPAWTERQPHRRRLGSVRVQAAAGEEGLKQSDKWGAPVSLGTALLPPDVDIGKLEALLFQVLSPYTLYNSCAPPSHSVQSAQGMELSVIEWRKHTTPMPEVTNISERRNQVAGTLHSTQLNLNRFCL